MLLFPNAKINLGLRILSRRTDGYHDIETVMVPVGLSDLLEFTVNDKPEISFTNTGIPVNCPLEDNLVFKAWSLLKKDFGIPYVKIHLHKFIPHGAGLGGGSSDAAFMLKGLNTYFKLEMDNVKLESYAALLGSDCAFFIRNTPCLATGRGEVLNGIEFSGSFYLVLLYPGFPISTREAYDGIIPVNSGISLVEILKETPGTWKDKLVNHFEASVFPKFPVLSIIKDQLYRSGAVYASMSGSGSAVYGLFREKPDLGKNLKDILTWEGKLF